MPKKLGTEQKKKKYVMKSSEREVYQREQYYELVVEDTSGVVRRKEEILNLMFEAFCNYKLKRFVASNFDSSIFETDVRVQTNGVSTYAQVFIREKNWFEKLIKKLIKK